MGTSSSNSSRHKYVKGTCAVLCLIVLGLFFVWIRAYFGSMKAFHKGEEYLRGKNNIRAITFFDRSIHWYAPFNPYVQKSAQRLWDIGERAQEVGDIKLALIAFRTIRRGFHSASSFYAPGKKWIERSELEIADLVIQEDKNRGTGNQDFKSSEKIPLPEQRSPPLSIFWSIVTELGFLGWVASAICFIIFVFRHNPNLNFFTPPALKWGVLVIICFLLWLLGMIKA